MPHPRLASFPPRTLLAAVAAAVLIGAAPAAAAPPPNDTPETAIDLGLTPFTQEVSIAEAGTEAPFDTKVLPRECQRDPVAGTVWYHFEATEDVTFDFLATTQEEWIAGVALVRELPTSRKTLALCGQEVISGSVEAGDDFWLVAFARTAAPTGTMSVSWDAHPSTVLLTLDSLTADKATGTVAATGTYTCAADPLEFGMLSLDLWPGTKKMESAELEITECTGEPTPFSLELTTSSGRLPGSVDARVSVFVCDDLGCDIADAGTKLKS